MGKKLLNGLLQWKKKSRSRSFQSQLRKKESCPEELGFDWGRFSIRCAQQSPVFSNELETF